MGRIRPPVKTHGGKWYLCPWIIDNFPKDYKNLSYTEVFVGGGSVILNKEPSKTETINDADRNICCVWRTLQDRPTEFYNRLKSLKYSIKTFETSKEALLQPGDVFETAVHEYVVRRMSRGGMRKAFAWSKRFRGGKPGDQNAWETSLELIPRISKRINNVSILQGDFRIVIEAANGEGHFLYLDPPYLKTTRAKGATKVYLHELLDKDHISLLKLCLTSKSKILLSGYDSQLYNSYLDGWKKIYKDVKNHSGQNSNKSTKREVLWKNY